MWVEIDCAFFQPHPMGKRCRCATKLQLEKTAIVQSALKSNDERLPLASRQSSLKLGLVPTSSTFRVSVNHLCRCFAFIAVSGPPSLTSNPQNQQIDDLRRERVLFDTIYKKMERELSDRKKMMANVIEVLSCFPRKSGGRVLSGVLGDCILYFSVPPCDIRQNASSIITHVGPNLTAKLV